MHTPGTVYYVYIVTNPNKTTLYIGVTNNLRARILEHWENRNKPETFAGRYFCYHLIYYETFQYIQVAIARETEIKKWNRSKKEALIQTKNPEWIFLNEKICGHWPPKKQ
ncbi:MAG: GIY-YIG nuclease family protein [Sphingobacteriales bacterium]|nr:GIY-YIG nuclease family protein [Sphingobacteriales bacterium]